jgi:hypothetical protein
VSAARTKFGRFAGIVLIFAAMKPSWPLTSKGDY